MKKFYFLLLLSFVFSLTAEDKLLKIHSIQDLSPVFKARPPDPENKRIKDGSLKNFSWWSVNIKQNPSAVLDIQLEQTAEVSKVVLHFYSHAPGKSTWQPILVELYREGKNGADVPVFMTGEVPPLNKRYMPYTINLKNIRSRRFKLRLNANRNLGISEIQFFGKAAVGKQLKAAASALFSAAAPKGVILRTADLDGDGKKEYILENSKVLYVLSSANGGTVDHAALRSTRKNFVKSRGNDSHGGMLGEVFRFGNMAAVWKMYRSDYKVTVLKNTPAEVTVKMEYDHGRNMPGPLVYSKTYTLRADSVALKGVQTIFNDGVNMVPWDEPFRLHSYLGNAAGNNRLFFNTPSGLTLRTATGESQVRDPIDGNAGIVDSQGRGMALTTDYKHLESFIFWGGKAGSSLSGDKFFTVEAVQGKRPVGPEQSESIVNYFIPFTGITAPSLVSSAGVGGFVLKGKRLEFKFFAAGNDKLTFKAGYVKNSGTPVSGKLRSGSVLISENWNGKSVKFELFSNNVPVGKAWFIGKDKFTIPRPARTVIPVSKPEKENLDLNFIDSSRQGGPEVRISNHLKKEPNIWFVGNKFYWAREVPEFIRRYGIKATVFPLGGTWRMGDNPKQLYANQSEKRFYDALDAKDAKFDVLAINGVSWRTLPQKRQDHILNLVKQGCGLYIWGEPGVKKFKTPNTMQQPVPASSHPVVNGTIWEYMPDSLLFEFKPEQGELPVIVSKNGRKNILTLQQYGKGRIVRSYWNTRYFPNSPDGRYNSSGFSPRMQSHYHWAIIPQVKALFWAAGKLPEHIVRIKKSELVNNKLFFEIANPVPAGTATADLHFFDSCGSKAEPAVLKVPFSSGKCSVSIPKDAHALFAVLRNKDGKILWWGGSSIANKESLNISFNADKEFYAPADTMTLQLQSSRKTPVKITLTDSFGRCFAAAKAVAPGKVAIPMKNALGTAVLVRVDAYGTDDRVVGRSEKHVYLTTRTNVADFAVDIAWMWVNIHGFPAPLMPSFWNELKKIGINTSSHFKVDNDNASMVYSARRSGLTNPTMVEKTSCGASTPGAKNAMNTKDKFKMIRRFCSNGTVFRNNFNTHSVKFHKIEEAGLIIGRMGPDELNSHAGTWEGCFCKGCQKAFREFVKKRYGTLQKLNEVWKTDYKDWESIIAETLTEAKKRGCFAGWIDHRESQEEFMAAGIGRLENNLRKRDPNAFYALSGTQDMTPFRALNWQKLMKHQHGLYSYVRFQTNQQRSFIAPGERIFWLQWVGYNRPLNEHTRRLAWHMAMGGTGAAVYSYYYVKPDLVPIKQSVNLSGALRFWSNGAGAAMIATRDSRPGVTVLFDSRAEKFNYAMGKGDAGKNNVLGFDLLAADTAVDWIWRSVDNLENTQLLFMPAVETVSDAAAAKLEEFVRNGGRLIAVQCSGKADENGNLRNVPALDRLLGIDTSKAVYKSGNHKLAVAKGELAGLNNFSLREMVSGATLRGAELLAGTPGQPVITVRKYGRGTAYYVGCDLFQIYSRMTTMRKFKIFEKQVNTLQKFMLSMAPERAVEILEANGKHVIGVRTVARVLGKAKLITAIDYQDPNMESPQGLCEDTSQLPVLTFKGKGKGKFFFYDLFSRKKLGEGESFRSNLKYPGGTLVFSMLQEAPAQIGVKYQKKGDAFVCTITSSPHPLLVTVKHNGKAKPAYRQIISVPGKLENKRIISRTYSFTPGLNEKGGKWEICVEDLFSDRQTSVTLP